jgi:hypothetical protein
MLKELLDHVDDRRRSAWRYSPPVARGARRLRLTQALADQARLEMLGQLAEIGPPHVDVAQPHPI